MDPKEKKPGENWPKLPPTEKLDILRRYRDKHLYARNETFLIADDFFIGQVVAENLEGDYMLQISNGYPL